MSTSSQFVKEGTISGKIKCDFLQNSIFAKKIRGGGSIRKKNKKNLWSNPGEISNNFGTQI